jgi:hypothetical protein
VLFDQNISPFGLLDDAVAAIGDDARSMSCPDVDAELRTRADAIRIRDSSIA